MNFLDGKKTYISLAIMLASLVSQLTPLEITEEDLAIIISEGEEIVVAGKRDFIPLITGLVGFVGGVWGRFLATR